eukprot:TRINITY_DN773089_c0_g1_i1.p1 TRINITY_DN773089_c0_g1~~TRINITY_DN773089_c0_g1_i1.p1  ORF type:complete len:265 (-),score=107.68 TRINITY_DN773089_c0_g1_i1:214-1008(-)
MLSRCTSKLARAFATVSKGQLVSVSFSGYIEGQAESVCQSKPDFPLKFAWENEPMLPGLERAVRELEIGECKNFQFTAEEAFGVFNPELIFDVELEKVDPAVAELEVGTIVALPTGQPGTIIDKTEEALKIDSNHPLVDHPMEFDIELISIEDAPELVKTVVTEGDNETFPKVGDQLVMHYAGRLASNDEKFDSSYDRGTPFEFTIGVGQVIKGWDEGVMKMSVGEKAEIFIPSEMGYGVMGAPPSIPPHSDLIFEVELLEIKQ